MVDLPGLVHAKKAAFGERRPPLTHVIVSTHPRLPALARRPRFNNCYCSTRRKAAAYSSTSETNKISSELVEASSAEPHKTPPLPPSGSFDPKMPPPHKIRSATWGSHLLLTGLKFFPLIPRWRRSDLLVEVYLPQGHVKVAPLASGSTKKEKAVHKTITT